LTKKELTEPAGGPGTQSQNSLSIGRKIRREFQAQNFDFQQSL